MARLEAISELTLDWLKYLPVEPSKSFRLSDFWESFRSLCTYLTSLERFECEIADFLHYFGLFQKSTAKEGSSEENHIEKSFDINHTDSRKKTILHIACMNGDLGVVKALIETEGIDLDIVDKEECTPLCIAIRDSHFEIAKLLIEAGADVNLGGGYFGSALHLAVVRANLLLVDMMIKRRAEVNVVDCDGNTPLHFMMNIFSKSETKYRAIAESLVMSGSKPNSKNKELWAPLHIAARKG